MVKPGEKTRGLLCCNKTGLYTREKLLKTTIAKPRAMLLELVVGVLKRGELKLHQEFQYPPPCHTPRAAELQLPSHLAASSGRDNPSHWPPSGTAACRLACGHAHPPLSEAGGGGAGVRR